MIFSFTKSRRLKLRSTPILPEWREILPRHGRGRGVGGAFGLANSRLSRCAIPMSLNAGSQHRIKFKLLAACGDLDDFEQSFVR